MGPNHTEVSNSSVRGVLMEVESVVGCSSPQKSDVHENWSTDV